MLRLNPRQIVMVFLSGIALMFGYSNCGVVSTPEAGSLASMGAGFSHAGITQSCASCHDTGEPFGAFPASGHPDRGGKDCGQCHGSSSWLMANPHLAGMPIPTTCISCHSSKLPAGSQGTATLIGNLTPQGGLFDHSGNGGGGDCVSCHSSVPENVGVTWAGGIYSHSPTPISCATCHTPGQVPVGPVGASPNIYDHANMGVSDCVSCHASVPANIGRSWQTTSFSHSPVPTACATCHLSDNNYVAIQNSIKNQMNHSQAGLPDCVSCHKGAAQSNGFSSWMAEAVVNKNWAARGSLGVLHANLASTPLNCKNCHLNEVPGGPQGSVGLNHNLTPWGGLFDHSANGGDGDCVTCHTSLPNNIGLDWSGGTYSHSPTPATCVGCHTSAQRPTGPVGSPAFDHSMGGTGDCKSCHSGSIGLSWEGGYFSHSPTPASCNSCHSNDPLYVNKKSTITNQMNHTVTGLPDCASCHASAAAAGGWAASSWTVEAKANTDSSDLPSKGVFHSNYASIPSTCQLCHSNERPTIVLAGFDHSKSGTGDCVGCHASAANVGLTWSGGAALPATVTITPPTGSSGWPTLTVPHPALANNAGMTCASCHGTTPANGALIGYDHSAGYSLASSVGCFYCHGTGQSVVRTSSARITIGPLSSTSSPNRHKGNDVTSSQNCQSCHAHSGVRLPSWNGTQFSGGGGF